MFQHYRSAANADHMEHVLLQKNALKHEGLFEEEQMPKGSTHTHQPSYKNKNKKHPKV